MEKSLEQKMKDRREAGRKRVQEFRTALYKDKSRHKEVLEKDKKRWKTYYVNKVKMEDPDEKRREKERL